VTVSRFRKLPVEIQAVQYTGDNADEVIAWVGPDAYDTLRGQLVIHTLEGDHVATPHDWIIRGVEGEHYPCKPSIFDATYEPIGVTGD
jgi:hypothetical protein